MRFVRARVCVCACVCVCVCVKFRFWYHRDNPVSSERAVRKQGSHRTQFIILFLNRFLSFIFENSKTIRVKAI
jgi:hypothetical protein